jgi:hypothetical protein
MRMAHLLTHCVCVRTRLIRYTQACFDLVNNESNTHYTVLIPAGTYKITQTLRLFRVLGGLIVGQVRIDCHSWTTIALAVTVTLADITITIAIHTTIAINIIIIIITITLADIVILAITIILTTTTGIIANTSPHNTPDQCRSAITRTCFRMRGTAG